MAYLLLGSPEKEALETLNWTSEGAGTNEAVTAMLPAQGGAVGMVMGAVSLARAAECVRRVTGGA